MLKILSVGFVSLAALFAGVRPFSAAGGAIRVATAFTSHTICSETFVSGLDPAQVYADSVKPKEGVRLIHWGIRYHVDRARRDVRTTFAGAFESRAVYRDVLGCIVERGAGPEDSSVPARASTELGRSLPEIAGPDVVETTNAGLRAALDRAFAERARAPYRRTKAVVILQGGRVVAERYAPGYGIGTPVLGFSATKSVISALVGILVRQGRLAVDQPAPVAAWRGAGDPRGAITLDHLLRMKSGLALDETNSGFDPSSRALYLERDMAGFAERARLKAPPGTRFYYSSAANLIVSRIIRDAVGGHAGDVLAFARRELFDPLGMSNVTLEFDATGTPMGSTSMLATPRDWARFGLLYANDGVAGSQRILPEGWVRYSSTPTSGSWRGYGAGFYTNVGSTEGARRRAQWGMPAESFFASGTLGQLIVVVPSERLVVARFGASHGDLTDVEGVSRLVASTIEALRLPPSATRGH